MTSQETSIGPGAAAVAAAVAVALLCLLALAPAMARAATGSISGIVTDAGTAEPIEGVEVCAWSLGEEWGFDCAHTETDGSYFLGGLVSGEYGVEFWSQQRYAIQFFDGKGKWSEADPVVVEPAVTTGEIDAQLQPTAAIEGTVLAVEDGLGVEEVEVCAYPLNVAEESFWECSETDGTGAYEINGLNPGNYKVEFWPGWTGRNLAYQYWDHKNRYAEADVVAVAEGERKEGIDGDLAPGGSIAGHVSGLATGAPIETRVCAIDASTDRLTVCTWSDEVGDYELDLLAADQYKVVFSLEFWEFFPGEAFPGEDDDGYPTQFWNNQTTLAAANVIALGVGGGVGGIDARLGGAPILTQPSPTVTPPHKRKRKCRRGYRRRFVHGKRRCVKVRKHHRHRHHRSGGTVTKRLGPGGVRFVSR